MQLLAATDARRSKKMTFFLIQRTSVTLPDATTEPALRLSPLNYVSLSLSLSHLISTPNLLKSTLSLSFSFRRSYTPHNTHTKRTERETTRTHKLLLPLPLPRPCAAADCHPFHLLFPAAERVLFGRPLRHGPQVSPHRQKGNGAAKKRFNLNCSSLNKLLRDRGHAGQLIQISYPLCTPTSACRTISGTEETQTQRISKAQK